MWFNHYQIINISQHLHILALYHPSYQFTHYFSVLEIPLDHNKLSKHRGHIAYDISDNKGTGIDVRESSHHVTIRNCYVHDCGCGGISGREDRSSSPSSRCFTSTGSITDKVELAVGYPDLISDYINYNEQEYPYLEKVDIATLKIIK